ncbi:MAG: polysaccharide deacetylase family protein [Oscillospiraceae bacterium]|nr:polysaccharide deacetylase family protein [Oscillospiraceae bacterium]
MQFGSVAFFKMLIKIVLSILFFLPLVLCIVFAVLLWNSNAKVTELKKDNERLEYYSLILSGEREPTVSGFYDIYARSGLSDEELIEYVLHGKDSGAQEASSVPDNSASSGASDTSEASQPVGQTDESQPTDTSSVPEESEAQPPDVQPVSQYAGIYPEMTVTPPAEDEYVRELGMVYLTFDDGPSDNTYSILSYLEQYNIKATFFVVPTRTESCYAKLRAIAEAGHSIGVHSASHVYKDIYSSVEAYLEDFHEAWDIIYDATGIKTELFRFPGGSVNDFNVDTRDHIIQEMTRRGFRYFDWNVDSNDAGGANWTDMYNSIPADIAENYRSVVLMHDSASTPNTVLVLGDVLHVLVNEGYKFDKINNDTLPVQFTGPFA